MCVCRAVAAITPRHAAMYSFGTNSPNRSLIELTKMRVGFFHFSGSSSFSGTRRGSNPCS
jgi:hypothetical protein